MNQARRRLSMVAIALAACAGLSACVVAPTGRYYDSYPVAVPPPAPQAEVVVVAPGPGLFWIGGYWGWSGRAHVWVPGRWERHRHGQYWAPHRWHHDGRAWHQQHGRWHQR